ncbi:uncharacterized protein K452DRAFT_129743 [Aplosporella prunicola CBS 121167]|uniref:CHY-type domain-containing protein n=1 Tax=Aplosporella prunicola CBS 121167 TaxID=1176127 RepID=A0A6A6AZR8_9PEZI|nr:uncharacterized protein K452DRAFT_129743 [Aplosporella prunicola CBS 121167]KAF2136455.1 hypothetical protein K452DRAFT_129743 [Aplosporella prunicola CBS 121167]
MTAELPSTFRPAPGPDGPSELASLQPHRSMPACRFFASKSGCRAGNACQFSHDPSRSKQKGPKPPQGTPADDRSSNSNPPLQMRHQPAAPVDPSKVVQRPTPRAQVEDPREFQIAQLRRRFSPNETQEADCTVLTFDMKPSDPDFPFDIDALGCILRVPLNYPSGARPSLSVTNKVMDRGYQINVEKGFEALASNPKQTLLGMLKELDRQLETILTAEKAETIKISIVPNAPKPSPPSVVTQKPAALPTPSVVKPAAPVYSAEQKALAKAKREQEARQFEARLGRLPQFAKLSDDAFVVPVEPRRRGDLPVALQAIKTIKLLVPPIYPLEPCRTELMGIDRQAARPLEEAFEARVRENPAMSLMNHVNYLSQNMHSMAVQPPQPPVTVPAPVAQQEAPTAENTTELDLEVLKIDQPGSQPLRDANIADEDRSHIITIPRPPEWTVQQGTDDDEDSSDSYSDDSDAKSGGEDDAAGTQMAPTSGPERGIMMSFPHLELYGIELMELVSLNLTVKCTRCKDQMDVTNIKNSANTSHTGVRSESCKKCAYPMEIGYRMDLMHGNSIRAGYLDLDGCTPVDMLPSNFVPTCSECSTQYGAPGVVSVRGESSMAMCRECHHKMTFRIPEVKFLLVSASAGRWCKLLAVRASRALPRKKAKEKLGIVAGQELPKRGRCAHYAKSHRWFRFSCCSKVYPCDRCHDQEAEHPNEHANRMICGFCSREQNYRPEDCAICHATLVGKKGSGFWEGGKGTRDKTKMSRKDPRKYKRRPGTAPRA